MVKTKGIEQTTKNWEGQISAVPGRYKSGVERTTNWQEKASGAEDLWASRMSEAISLKSRKAGIDAISNEEWKRRASEKGSTRIAEGMRAASGEFRNKMGEVLSVIEGIALPERTADPLANVDNRNKPIVKGLYDYKRRK